MPKQPDATLKFADAEAKLFLRARRINDGAKDIDCDEVIVQPVTGNEDDAVVYMQDGERKVGRVRRQLASPDDETASFPTASLPTSIPTSISTSVPKISDAIEPVNSDDEKRLLAIYDRLLTGVAA